MDAYAAVRYVLYNADTFAIDPKRVTLGGTSTGASIALILNHLARDEGWSDVVKGVIVGTPNISDLRKYASSEQSPYPSMHEMECAPTLDFCQLKWFDTMKWMSLQSVGRDGRAEQQKDVSWFADLMSAPNLKDLAPLIWIGTAECDPLRDEGEAYGDKLRENGNHVIMRRFLGVPHLFMHMNKELEQGQQFINDVVKHTKSAIYS